MTPLLWLLVADATQARLFACEGDSVLRPLQSWQGKFPSGPRGDEFLRRDQQRFPKKLASWLNGRGQEFQSLVLVASPRILSDLKEFLQAEVRSRIQSEIHEDWSKVDAHDLPARLARAKPLQTGETRDKR